MIIKLELLRTLIHSDGDASSNLEQVCRVEMRPFIERNIQEIIKVERLIASVHKLGRRPLWEGYRDLKDYGRRIEDNAQRGVVDVRTEASVCVFYAWLVTHLKPSTIVEFGAAFGSSGLYWLTGLKHNGQGHLYSFEPNEEWADIAERQFQKVCDDFTLTRGTYEDNHHIVPKKIDLALIDAIHTSDFVLSQFEIIRKNANRGAIVIFDDIDFSDDMKDCWATLKRETPNNGIWEITSRVGIIKLP